MNVLDLRAIAGSGVLEMRGDGKAGGGLVVAFQSLAHLLGSEGLHVQEWPFFSSARRGANIRSFLRASALPIEIACEVTRPSLVLLMDEAAGKSVDFAQGVPAGGTFVLNTPRAPAECARHFGLSGQVITVPGDDIGRAHLQHSIGNVAAYVAMTVAIGGFEPARVVDTFLAILRKRRIPERLLERNRAALRASLGAVRREVCDAGGAAHEPAAFAGYGELPVGAQTALRLSRTNRTADFARSGFRLRFADPETRCSGCAHCITNCPEGIIRWRPDAERGLLVTGVDVDTYCKLCGECIAVCPEHLFAEAAYVEDWGGAAEAAS
ncbi:MAG TPA: 2-oxoacid:acceptor oxidoreductase family protein [Candidatus Eisenbacteria bacterium]|nr:2-oxoacid:acceptor oxidoreductase family protein [Candidatus Eisenbacteria bacterium]